MIYKATMTDLPAIVDIERASFKKPWSESLFMDALNAANKNLLIYKKDGVVVGFVVVEIVADEGHVTDLAVDKNNRKKGIGMELMAKAIQVACDHNVKNMFLEVRQSNDAAIKLYTKIGFNKIAERKGYYQPTNEDAIVFQKTMIKS